MKQFCYFSLILSCFFVGNQLQAQCNGVSESDSLELVKFYEALGGDDWTNNEGWLVEPVKEWYKVKVTEDGCNVEEINMRTGFDSGNNLIGNLPDLNLPNLKILELSYNHISGSIPDLKLPELKEFLIIENQLTGSIPNFSNLPNLERLSLKDNQLNGMIPDFSNLPNLELLSIKSNQINGPIPDFTNLPKLIILNLAKNQLVGIIPNFSNLPNVTVLDLYENQLTGNVPNFTNMERLQFLILFKNQLTGNIPNFGNIPILRDLSLSDNQLSGNVPDFSNLVNLKRLSLTRNQLSGTIPNFSNLPNLENLSLTGNELIGNIPNFNNLPKLESLNLNENKLTGSIPDFDSLPNLDWLFLQENKLSESVPNFSKLLKLKYLYLYGNKLAGEIPNYNLPELNTLALSNNQFSGSIPNFDKLPNLELLFVENNQLTGYLPNFLSSPRLDRLRICPNNLIGPIPNFDAFHPSNLPITDFSCLQTPTLTGTAYHDLNQNCLQDEGEEPLKNTKITANDNQFTTFTDENGFFTLQLDIGTFEITATPPNFLWSESCPESYTVSFENYTDTIPQQNFGFSIEDECTLLTIDIATPLQRRCFQNTYTVSYCNEGTRTAENAYIELTFPPDIIPLSASIPFEQDGDVFSFDLGALEIGACGSFTVRDSVSCEAVLGSTACVEGRIYPAFLCRETSALWDGADIEVSGECVEGAYIQFTLSNVGLDMQDSIEYRIYEDDILSATHLLQLLEGESQNLEIAATGKTYRLVAAQTDFHPAESVPQVVVELCGDAPYSLGFVNTHTYSDLEHFIDIDCSEIIGAYDPNDKAVSPKGIAAQGYIEEGTELTYKIRFQNTGSDTAFRVTIIDTLNSEFLNLQSFKILSASHDYKAWIQDENVLIVEFNNILLPDSTTNEVESHGFVQYRITPFQDAPKKSIITNVGDIYFDYNQPITTNTVSNTIGIPELDVALPIELLQFDAYLDENGHAQLTWITASEIDNSHFEVLRSNDGRNFETIGKIGGKGTSNETHFYALEDTDLPSKSLSSNVAVVYYRLKQVDFNGQFTFSQIISLSIENEGSVKVWFDTTQTHLEIIGGEGQVLQVFDVVGRLVQSWNIIGGKQRVNLQELESGMYVYRLLDKWTLEGGKSGKFLVRN